MEIIKAVQQVYGLTDIEKKTRKRPYPEARQVACYFIISKKYKEGSKLTLEKIGKMLNINYATVINGYNVVTDTMKFNRELRERVQEVENLLMINEPKEVVIDHGHYKEIRHKFNGLLK